MKPNLTPIFLHGWWRTGTKYIWQKFREQPGLCCYMEPFHEILEKLNMPTLLAHTAEKAPENHHPASVTEPYFAEFKDLIAHKQGVACFVPELAYQDFILDPNQPSDRTRLYVKRLLDHAGKKDLRPVLQFCRSMLRVAWLKKHFAGLHVGILRNPRDQWASYVTQLPKNPYFLEKTLLIAGLERAHDWFAPLHKEVKLPETQLTITQAGGSYQTGNWQLDWPKMYLIFYYMWALSFRVSLTQFDHIIDTNQLARSPATKKGLNQFFLHHADLDIYWNDCELPTYGADPQCDMSECEAKAVELLCQVRGLPSREEFRTKLTSFNDLFTTTNRVFLEGFRKI